MFKSVGSLLQMEALLPKLKKKIAAECTAKKKYNLRKEGLDRFRLNDQI